ncbi:MAG TPA: nucleoside triphosphate pyrophosphohydrolase [Bellilinea sp.]|nr:nucleoside triphosphate pyrophosphohydrolase [Bellilinea sp.]
MTDPFKLIPNTIKVLNLAGLRQFTIIDADDLENRLTPPFTVTMPVFIYNLTSDSAVTNTKRILRAMYPVTHPLSLVFDAEAVSLGSQTINLEQLGSQGLLNQSSVLFVPQMETYASMESFQEVIARLRAPGGCDWDRKQTHASLRKYLLEETYEAAEAIDSGDISALTEELGDVLLQILLHAQIGLDDGEFTLAQVIAGIGEKIVRRHPHVFGEVQVDGVEGILRNWQALKDAEKAAKGEEETSMLDGIPRIMPALSQSQEIQSRAAKVNFDWQEIAPVYQKVLEELDEVRGADSAEERQKEIGDLLFAVVNLARWVGADAEEALNHSNRKFRRRFAYIESQAKAAGQRLSEVGFTQLDAWWDEAKKME